MDMAAESVLQLTANPGVCGINPTFTAIVEGRSVKEVPYVFDTIYINRNIAFEWCN